MNSNVTIAPNIYVREFADVQNDDEFVKRVYGHKALNILKTQLSKTYASKFTRVQIEEMKQNVICRHSKTREHAYGKVLLGGDGQNEPKTVWSCRCENTECYAYDKCMNLPNALRIVRGDFKDAGYEGYKSDDDDNIFNPPPKPIAVSVPETPETPKTDLYAESYCPPPDSQVLVVCESAYETGYFSTILYKNKVRHRVLRSEGYTLNRRIADVFWDYCSDTIDKDAFFDRCQVRLGLSDEELSEFYDALFKLCGDSSVIPEGVLKISSLADALNESPELISECVLNMDDNGDFPVTLCVWGSSEAAAALKDSGKYNDIFYLECDNAVKILAETAELSGLRPSAVKVIKKKTPSDWRFAKSALGRPYRIGKAGKTDGTETQRCLNVELGLWGDVDGKSFLADQIGDTLGLQNYISEKIREGDELVIEKNSDVGGYWFWHNGNALGRVPDEIIREMHSIEGFPEGFTGFDGIYVRNAVTCLSEKDDPTVPLRFRETRVWLGLDITGYANVLI